MNNSTSILYTQAGCADSDRVRDWLTVHDVSFIERNVTSDDAAARELIATGIFATPLLVVGNAIIFGFRPDKFAAALELDH